MYILACVLSPRGCNVRGYALRMVPLRLRDPQLRDPRSSFRAGHLRPCGFQLETKCRTSLGSTIFFFFTF